MAKRIMRKFTIREISGVDVPAQEGARALIMKRRDPKKTRREMNKGGLVQAVTSNVNGHIHGISISKYGNGSIDIWMQYATGDGDENSHDHSLLVNADGTYTVLENAGHTHDLDSGAFAAALMACINKSGEPEDGTMTKEELAKMQRLESISKMSPNHFSHYAELSEDDQGKFLAKSEDERTELITKAEKATADALKAANDADPLVYTTKAGIEIRKSAGDVMLALAKSQDAQAVETAALKTENAELRKSREDIGFEKRASTELDHLPGTLKARASLLKAAESIEDEGERKQAVAALKAQNEMMAPLFKSIGTSAVGADGVSLEPASAGVDTATEQLDALVQKCMTDEKIAEPLAYAKVLDTSEGQDLYRQTIVN